MAEERHRALMENIPAVVYVDDVDETNSVIYRSPYVREVLGYEPEEFLSDPEFWQNLLHPSDRERVLAENERTNETGQPFRIEYRMTRKDGRIVWIRDEAVLIRDDEGRPKFWQGYFVDITERKLTEERLEASEVRYRNLVERVPAVIYVRSPQPAGAATDHVVYMSPKAEEVFGYPAQRFVEDPEFWNKLIHAKDLRKVLSEDARTDATGEPFLLEYRMFRKDGRMIWVRDGAILIRSETGDPLYWQGVASDVTARKEAEEQLREAEARYRSVVESVREVVFRTDAQGRWTFLNPAWEEIMGFSVEESLGQSYLSFVHPEDLERNLRDVEGLGEHGEDHSRYEARFLTRDGAYRWMEANFREQFDEEGNLAGTSGTLDDVTKRKEAEEALRRSEERFRSLVQNASDLIAILDAEGRARYLSPSFEGVQGYGRDVRAGRNAFSYVHPDDRAAARIAFEGLLEREGSTTTLGFRFWRAGGTWRYLEGVGRNLLSDPAVEGVVINARDVTASKELEERLRHQASHDPLTGLPNRTLLTDRLRQALSRAKRAGSELAVLFVDLDDFKKVNDAFGHETGDRLLAGVADRLRWMVRPEDTVGRLGGDEFVILLEGAGRERSLGVAERIVEAMKKPFDLGDAEARVTVSVGVAPSGSRTWTPDDLLKEADRAMYRAKAGGKSRREP